MADFTCAICQRLIDTRWNSSSQTKQIPPVCRLCEGWYTEGVGKPKHGAFRDRREAMRIAALAEALHNQAAVRRYNHARA